MGYDWNLHVETLQEVRLPVKQGGKNSHLRLVETSRRKDIPRLRVRISVQTDRCPFGRSREFRFCESQLAELLAAAERIAGRS